MIVYVKIQVLSQYEKVSLAYTYAASNFSTKYSTNRAQIVTFPGPEWKQKDTVLMDSEPNI